ncbi:MAG: site-2 protease family protein [Caldicoprobacterales bacterium]|jgi:Zn-dependent protease|nr:site-2 protease family protein [Clostridiales bacterium]
MFRQPMEIILSLPAVFLALSFHEFAHAWTADRLGDDTPRKHGRLTLAPLVHIDWMGLVLFALFGFGWAKPVQVNPSKFRKKRLGDILVALSGPAANLLTAVIAVFLYVALSAFAPNYPAVDTILAITDYIIYLNIVFCLLNLLPIPPLDGYRIIKNLFFRSNIRLFLLYERYGTYILIAFLLLGLFDTAVSIPAYAVYRFLVSNGMKLLGL